MNLAQGGISVAPEGGPERCDYYHDGGCHNVACGDLLVDDRTCCLDCEWLPTCDQVCVHILEGRVV